MGWKANFQGFQLFVSGSVSPLIRPYLKRGWPWGLALDSHDNNPINWRSLWTFSFDLIDALVVRRFRSRGEHQIPLQNLTISSRALSVGNLPSYPTNWTPTAPVHRKPPIKGYEIKGQLTRCRQAPVVLSPSYKATSRKENRRLFAPTEWSTISFVRLSNNWTLTECCFSSKAGQNYSWTIFSTDDVCWKARGPIQFGVHDIFIQKSLTWPEGGRFLTSFEGWKPEENGMHTSAADMDYVAYSCCMWVRNGTTTTQIHLFPSQVPSSNVFRRHFLRQVEGNTLRFWFFLIWISVTSGQTCAISQSYKSIDWVHALSLSDNLTSLAKTSQSQFQWQATLCRPCSHPPNWLSAKDAAASGSTTSNAVPQHVLARTPRQ